ncbi:MAG: IS66 family transposase, partial [Thermodesulfobacteriota bacterium]
FAVLWRKRSLGTYSEKGCRWVERILTVRQTCRLRGQPTFPIVDDAIAAAKGQPPDLSWLKQ